MRTCLVVSSLWLVESLECALEDEKSPKIFTVGMQNCKSVKVYQPMGDNDNRGVHTSVI